MRIAATATVILLLGASAALAGDRKVFLDKNDLKTISFWNCKEAREDFRCTAVISRDGDDLQKGKNVQEGKGQKEKLHHEGSGKIAKASLWIDLTRVSSVYLYGCKEKRGVHGM